MFGSSTSGFILPFNYVSFVSTIINGFFIIDFVYLLLSAVGYDAMTWTCLKNNDANACLVQADIKREWMVFFGTQGFVINMLLPQMMPWKYGMYKAQQAAEQPAASLLVDF